MSRECSHACGGVCCRSFPLSISREYLHELADKVRADGADNEWARDTVMIDEMLVPLGSNTEGVALYTCKHFAAEAGLCTVYATRPALCREYPYDRACLHCGYTNPALAPKAEDAA